MSNLNKNILEDFLVSMSNIIDAANVYLEELSSGLTSEDDVEKVANDKNENQKFNSATDESNKESDEINESNKEENRDVNNVFDDISFSSYEYRWETKTLSDKSTTDEIYSILDKNIFENLKVNTVDKVTEISFVLPKDELTLELKWNYELGRFEGKYYVIDRPEAYHNVYYDEIKRSIIFVENAENKVYSTDPDVEWPDDCPDVATVKISPLEGVEDFVIEPAEEVEIPSEEEYFKNIQNIPIPPKCKDREEDNKESEEVSTKNNTSKSFAEELYEKLNVNENAFDSYINDIKIAVDRIFEYDNYEIEEKEHNKINKVSFTLKDIILHAKNSPWGDYYNFISNFNFDKFSSFMKDTYGFAKIEIFHSKMLNRENPYVIYCTLI